MDITNGFDIVINLILQGFTFVYQTLDEITFHGISLLDFMLWILCLGIILPIVLTLLTAAQGTAADYASAQERRAESEARWQRHQAQIEASRKRGRKG